MTATLDLIIVGPPLIQTEVAPKMYVTRWFLLNYTDTSGLWDRSGTDLVFQVKGVGRIIDALWGDGPERHGLGKPLPVHLANLDFHERKAVEIEPSLAASQTVCVVERTQALVAAIEEMREMKGKALAAIPLERFQLYLSQIPPEELRDHKGEKIKPWNAFLMALPKDEHYVIPCIGIGLHCRFGERGEINWHSTQAMNFY